MSNSFTKYNHYNPCFWTAYWNRRFFQAAIADSNDAGEARDQKIYTLNLHSRTIRETTTQKIFFHKNLGRAKITPDSAKKFCKKYYPLEYENFCKDIDQDNKTYYINLEQILTHLEKWYDSLLTVIKTSTISSQEEKAFLTCVFITHALRGYAYMSSRLDLGTTLEIDKWEFFWLFKKALEDPQVLMKPGTPFISSHWILYPTKKHTFPLSDSPVMIGNSSIMVTLSPRLLLEVNLKLHNAALANYQVLTPGKYREFQQRTISNAFNDIIFHDRDELQKWLRLPELINRSSIVNNQSTRKEAINNSANRILWAMNGFDSVKSNEQPSNSYLGF